MHKLSCIKINEYIDPFTFYKRIKNYFDSMLLESSMQNYSGEYSFIGVNSFINIKYDGSLCSVNDVNTSDDIFVVLKKVCDTYQTKTNTTCPFSSGMIGYISYDFAEQRMNICKRLKSNRIPLINFVGFDVIVAINHKNSELFIYSLEINHSIYYYKKLISKVISDALRLSDKVDFVSKKDSNKIRIVPDYSRQEYLEKVEKMRDFIKQGDIYISNMTQIFTVEECQNKNYDIYDRLREKNPSPFSAFLEFDDVVIMSSSPERFIKIDGNRHIITKPIKGTRPRGKCSEEDIKFKQELLQSEKDRSELLMIVDLERNDLSKICKPGSVRVDRLYGLESYNTVYHLVSTVSGDLENNINSIDAIENMFPGGSITGAPKKRAMEIISLLESQNRGIYTGCLGYIDFNGNVDFSIVIRTIVKHNNKLYIGSGGGITWESNCIAEYQEILDKAEVLFSVL